MSRFPIPRPHSDDGTLVPALLVGLLTGMLVLQLVLPGSGDPPPSPDGEQFHFSATVAPAIGPVIPARIILERPVFSPQRTVSNGADADPLSGAQVAGAWSTGGRANLILRLPNGSTRTIRVGQATDRWVLAAVTNEGARFARDGRTVLVPFGTAAPQDATSQDSQPEEENQ